MPGFGLIDKGGERLLPSIRGEILVEGRTAVGILLDANGDPQSKWQAVSDRLRDAGVTAPKAPAPGGTIIEGLPRVGVWVMPDNQSPGELEDFIERMIPSSDRVWPLSKAYIDGIPLEDRKFADGKVLRAKVHAWLATRASPRRMGTAIGAGDLDLGEANSGRFVDWLRNLFS